MSVDADSTGAFEARLDALVEYIDSHLHDDLSSPALALRLGVSVRQLARAFRARTSRSPHAFVAERRAQGAARLLAASTASLEEIAALCGLGSVSTLGRTFRAVFGVAPSRYRARAELRRRAADSSPRPRTAR